MNTPSPRRTTVCGGACRPEAEEGGLQWLQLLREIVSHGAFEGGCGERSQRARDQRCPWCPVSAIVRRSRPCAASSTTYDTLPRIRTPWTPLGHSTHSLQQVLCSASAAHRLLVTWSQSSRLGFVCPFQYGWRVPGQSSVTIIGIISTFPYGQPVLSEDFSPAESFCSNMSHVSSNPALISGTQQITRPCCRAAGRGHPRCLPAAGAGGFLLRTLG